MLKENIWWVLRVKTPFLSFSGVMWTENIWWVLRVKNSVFKFLRNSVDLAQEKSYNKMTALKLAKCQEVKIFSEHSKHRVKRLRSGSRIQTGRRLVPVEA